MKLTWYGHSAFRVESGGRKNPDRPVPHRQSAVGQRLGGAGRGHHPCAARPTATATMSAMPSTILKKTGAMLVANFEICMYLVGQGVERRPDQSGQSSAARSTAAASPPPSSMRCIPRPIGDDDGSNTYLGNPAGLVLHFADDRTLYHMGDTDIFSDMALINELHQPEIGIVPIGDRFTMGGAVAALACRRFFNFKTVIPCHYGTFPLLDQTPDKFVAGMEGSASRSWCRSRRGDGDLAVHEWL